MTLWILLAAMCCVTMSLRTSFLLLPPHVQLPAPLRRALRFVPAAVLTAGALFGDLSDTAWQASVLQAGMPPMVLAGIMATEAGLDDELSSFVIGAGLVLAAVTLPLLKLVVT